MFFHFISGTQLIILIHQVVANWRLIDQSFLEIQIANNNWKLGERCSDNDNYSISYSTCSVNQLQYIKLNQNRQYLYKLFRFKIFQARLIFDVFYDDADNSQDSDLEVSYYSNQVSDNDIKLYQRRYKKSDLNQNSARICHSSWGDFESKTIVSTVVSSNTNKFTIKFCFNPENEDMVVGIKNVLIYVNTCHPTCLTCNGPTETDCLSCFDIQSVQGGKCICIPDQQFSETYIGCLQECSRENSIARFDKICVNDTRIKANFTLFQDAQIPLSNQRYFPLIYQQDDFNQKNSDLVYENCNGIDFIGKFQFNEGMIYQMSFENAVKFIRIRITFYMFNFYETSNIEILHNNQIQSKIIKYSSDFQVENSLKIFEKNQICNDNSYTLLRVETTFQLFNPNPIILIKGQTQYINESWGFRNVTVDTGFCQENCLICSDFYTCTQCSTTYQLYKNKCVLTCPIHSSNCIDYEDIVPYSRYIAKGFYDLNMTLDEIQSFYDTTTDPSSIQSSSQKFSFLNNKIVLGGLLVWNDGSYIKTWSISKPHYAASIYFNLTYGDGYTGSFSYKIGASSSSQWSALFSKLVGGQNLVGRTDLESTRYFNISLTNFQSNNLYVEFKCDVATANITKEFCAISEYFIVIHYCPPFCSSCTSLSTCLDSGYTGQNCDNNQYLDFNPLTETYSCIDCNQSGCYSCTSQEECTQCVSNQFYLTNGLCLCNPFTYLQGNNCFQCNKYCENCYGNSQFNCLTCVRDYNRSIQKHQCQCLPGYYDDGINLPCLPICGDLLRVEGEDCDDGNNNPFDGCHNCKFSCNFACDICLNGKCYQCKSGYEVYNNDCRSNCLGNTITLLQQCNEDQKNCFNCQQKCPLNCIDCLFGSCIQCDEDRGWYIQIDGTCNSICGDGIVSHDEQCDNGNLLSDFQCVNCKLQCQEECTTCVNGECYQCIQAGWQLNDLDRNCQPICGDLLVLGNEQCDDGNYLDNDGCDNCKFQLQEQCSLYDNGQCRVCNVEGWELTIYRCSTICGDQLILGTEECDDGNLIPYDGCYECKFSCEEQCTLCENGVCQACLKPGWIINQQNVCTIQCGDGIVIDPYEQCDDGNDIPYDGCYQCEFQCSQGCIECQQEQCKKCDYLYHLDIQTAQCLKKNILDDYNNDQFVKMQLIQQTNLRCGENQMLIDHECDDENNYGGDGCSNLCHIEDSFQCMNQQDSLSLCTYILAPEFNLNIQSDKTQQTQIVELTFTQQVKLKEALNLEEIMVFNIIPATRYHLTTSFITNLTISLNNPKYIIYIEFFEPIYDPILQVDIQKNTIINQYELNLQNNNKTVNLGTPFVLSETTKLQLTSIVQLNDVMMYSMAGVSSLALVTGNAIMFFNLLELLQSLSYVRYMQCSFPPHLNYFLNTYTKISMQPIFDYLQIDQLLHKLNGENTSNQETNKLQEDKNIIFNQSYLLNAKSCYFSIFSSALTYIIYCELTSESLQNLINKLFQKFKQNIKILKLLSIFQRKIQKKCIIQKREYFSNGIFKVYFAILHQFMFSSILQFPNYQFDSLFSIFNSINSIFGLMLILISNLSLLQITTAKIKDICKWKYFYIETNTGFWAAQFKAFQIYRILCYIFIIVKLRDYPEAQSILLSIQSLLFLIYMIKFKPLKSLFELSKLICREFLLTIISGTFLAYSFELSQDNFILIGWIHISMFSTIMASNLFIDLFSQFKRIYDNYKQKKIKQKIQEEREYQFKHLQGFSINKNDYQQNEQFLQKQ
ncbi:unnamed protein product [Paramecium sonneborni]|uniref:Insulin-like growth factor binding protein, N-terminal n=1 Tax=Paramecium sonneborni TaxID=65129 RepID=A0A8S1Q1M7_9CILI|nr:unnamed protein product [Paramecium sonneborni]